MPTCSFCKKIYEFPRGLTIFINDGRAIFFCSSKCRRNMDLKRDPRKTNWVIKKKKTNAGKQKKTEKTADLSKEEAKPLKTD